ncbi:hypothetical protein [Cupriavidus necator]
MEDQFPQHPNEDEEFPEDVKAVASQAMEWQRRTRRYLKAAGRDAWSQFQIAAKGGGKRGHQRKLTPEEAAVLARNVHEYLERVEPLMRDRGCTKAELCHKAFGHSDSKELYRLTLPPGTDPKKRAVRVTIDKYFTLISTLADVLCCTVDRIASCVLRGTRFQVLGLEEFSELEKIQLELQHITDQLEAHFAWYAIYRLTADTKAKVIESGTANCWPLWAPGSFDPIYGRERTPQEVQKYKLDFKIATDPKQAYYRLDTYRYVNPPEWGWYLNAFESGALQDDEFFFVPHCPLGYMLFWDLPSRREEPASYAHSVTDQLHWHRTNWPYTEPEDEWDEAIGRPWGQTSGRKNTELQYFFWLIAYPHPDGGRVVPTLYSPRKEGGAYLLPLDLVGLEMLADAVWHSKTEHCYALERIKRLLVDKDGEGKSTIERAFLWTGGWLDQNPILKQDLEGDRASVELDRIIRERLREESRMAGGKPNDDLTEE